MIRPEGSLVAESTITQCSSLASPLQSFSSLTLSSVLWNQGVSQELTFTPINTLLQDLKSEDKGLLLIQLLLKCAGFAAAGHMEYTNLCLEQLSFLASLTGDPMQRVASYFMEGLASRITKSWPGLYRALHCTQLPSTAGLSAHQIYFNLCPYLKFAFTVANQCILDAMEGEKVVHFIDLGTSDATQWVALLQMLSSRVDGPPHLKITIINERKEVLDKLGQRLFWEAENLDIPFQFNPVLSRLDCVDADMLKVKTGEAVAVCSILQLHSLLSDELRSVSDGVAEHVERRHDMRTGTPYVGIMHGKGVSESVSLEDRVVKRTRGETFTNSSSFGGLQTRNGDAMLCGLFENEGMAGTFLNKTAVYCNTVVEQNDTRESNPVRDDNSCTSADRILCMLQNLAPKVMVIMEQEGNHNSPSLMERFVEALHYYSAAFDSLESTLPAKLFMERVTIEKHLFGKEIHNIVACEGLERVERHEKMERWKKRAERAGFACSAFNNSTVMQAKQFLSYTSEHYRLVEDVGCLRLCWQTTPLFSVCVWQS